MARPHGTAPGGTPLDLIGQPLGHRAVPGVGITFIPTEVLPMAKADSNGVYTLNGGRFRIRKGDPLPADAEFVADVEVTDTPVDEPEVEERAEKKAPENRAKKSAPENRSEQYPQNNPHKDAPGAK